MVPGLVRPMAALAVCLDAPPPRQRGQVCRRGLRLIERQDCPAIAAEIRPQPSVGKLPRQRPGEVRHHV
jgi:hypothetical protein